MYKYYHPKEVLITHGIVQQDLVRCINENKEENQVIDLGKENLDRSDEDEEHVKTYSGLDLIYPFGCSLRVNQSSQVLFSSGPVSYPVNEAILASYRNDQNG